MMSMLINIEPLLNEAGSSSEATTGGLGIKVGVFAISILRWTILPLGSFNGFGSRRGFGETETRMAMVGERAADVGAGLMIVAGFSRLPLQHLGPHQPSSAANHRAKAYDTDAHEGPPALAQPEQYPICFGASARWRCGL